MDVIYWYVLFAVTTSFASMYELFVPVIQILEVKEPKHNMVEYKWLTYTTFFLFSILMAPLILPACIVPSMGVRFREALLTSLS
jgi:hypothetical protein